MRKVEKVSGKVCEESVRGGNNNSFQEFVSKLYLALQIRKHTNLLRSQLCVSYYNTYLEVLGGTYVQSL